MQLLVQGPALHSRLLSSDPLFARMGAPLSGAGTVREHPLREGGETPPQLIAQGGGGQHLSLRSPGPKPGPAWPWQFGEVL